MSEAAHDRVNVEAYLGNNLAYIAAGIAVDRPLPDVLAIEHVERIDRMAMAILRRLCYLEVLSLGSSRQGRASTIAARASSHRAAR